MKLPGSGAVVHRGGEILIFPDSLLLCDGIRSRLTSGMPAAQSRIVFNYLTGAEDSMRFLPFVCVLLFLGGCCSYNAPPYRLNFCPTTSLVPADLSANSPPEASTR